MTSVFNRLDPSSDAFITPEVWQQATAEECQIGNYSCPNSDNSYVIWHSSHSSYNFYDENKEQLFVTLFSVPCDYLKYDFDSEHPWFCCYNQNYSWDGYDPGSGDGVSVIELYKRNQEYGWPIVIKQPLFAIEEEVDISSYVYDSNYDSLHICLATYIGKYNTSGRTVLLFYATTVEGELELIWNSQEDRSVSLRENWNAWSQTVCVDNAEYVPRSTSVLAYNDYYDWNTLANTNSWMHEVTYSVPETVYYITAEAGEGGYITPSGTNPCIPGDSFSFDIFAYAGYKIKDVYIDGVSVGPRSDYTFGNIQKSHSIAVEFEKRSELVLTVITQGQGTISPSGTQVEMYEGQLQQFIISPNNTYIIKSVKLNDEEITPSSANRYNITIYEDSILEVIFEQDPKYQVNFYSTKTTAVSLNEKPYEECYYPVISSNGELYVTHIVENDYLRLSGGAKYLKVLDHNVASAPQDSNLYFESSEEAQLCFKINKFSRLGALRSNLFKSKTDGKYEFLLMYPETAKLNHWKQAANPYSPDFDTTSGNLTGYEEILIQMHDRWGKDDQGNVTAKGLGISQNPETLLDTQPGLSENWWGGLGQTTPYTEHGTTGFPTADHTIEQHVQLWVRVDNTNYDAYTAIQKISGDEYVLYSDKFIEN